MTEPLVPRRLEPGSHVRVVAPARSRAIISSETATIADRRFAELGLRVSFGRHVDEIDAFASSSIESRVADLHEAFADPDVDAIVTAIGGFNSNQLLDHLDWDLIAANPKILCGYSDITALLNAVLRHVGLVTYLGPHWSTFGMEHHLDTTREGFRRCLFDGAPFDLEASADWSDDLWFLDQENRRIEPNDGWWTYGAGSATGRLVGGNLATFCALSGTRHQPDLAGSVVLLEDDDEARPWHIDRGLENLIHQPGFDAVAGLVIGRFQRATGMSRPVLDQIVATKPELARLPIVANVDFGHTSPILTVPIGGQITIDIGPHRSTVRIDRG